MKKQTTKDLHSRPRRLLRECCSTSMASLLFFLSLVFGFQFAKCLFLAVEIAPLPSSPTPSTSSTNAEEFGSSLQWHSMSDEELMRRAAEMPPSDVERRRSGAAAKVAFMFLTRGRIPLRPLWERFFKGHTGLFSIYIHASPEFNVEPPEDSVFFKRRIPSKPVQWGRWSILDAERRLLANALLDPSNQRFVLLSESCIPLFGFPTVYAYLLDSTLSFVSSFDDPRRAGRGRYNRLMHPTVALADWRKGPQWFELHRRLAAAIVADRRYYPLFREHCRSPCYLDEHYVPTLVTKLFPGLNANRSVTWADWSRGGSHPATYNRGDVSVRLLQRMRSGSKCAYSDNATTSTCFLFAR
ncbi:hypothetical protein Cni_G12703 [Canna indica]|uniref:Core-2/I-branching beta-1,6-N-acetylglucosaminyltransferase family protein n=1 Tax=Canna indica TaxID=4628 RepID=A0AAQ3K8A6_9LILI|nr:hypothetical protein Cni_G12703 [Canna indica]